MRARGDFQPLDGFQAEQAQLLVELVVVQNVVEDGVRVKVAGARRQETAPVAAKAVVTDDGYRFRRQGFQTTPSNAKALTVGGQGLSCQTMRRGFDVLITGARRVGYSTWA